MSRSGYDARRFELLKILHLLHGFPPEHDGGTELYVARLAGALADHGEDVVIAAGSYTDQYDGFTEGPATMEGVRVLRVSQRGLYAERWDRGDAPQVELEVRALLERERPDVVHVHHWIRLTRVLADCVRAAGIPVVLTLHDFYTTCPRITRVREGAAFCERTLSVASCLHCVPREDWVGDDIVALQIERFRNDMARELELASALIAPSHAHARALAGFAGVELERIEVVPHASLGRRPLSRAGAAWSPSSGRALRVAHWGHLLPFKGAHLLLEAVRATGRSDAFEVVLWGRADEPGYAARLAELSEGLHVERRETFGRDDLVAMRADLAVFATMAHESFSFVLDEAFELGVPVLASDRGALPERIDQRGVTFPPGDVASLAGLLCRALDQPDWLAGMRADPYTPLAFERHAREIRAIYDRVLADPGCAYVSHSTERLASWEQVWQRLESRARDLAWDHRAAEDEVRALRVDLRRAWRGDAGDDS